MLPRLLLAATALAAVSGGRGPTIVNLKREGAQLVPTIQPILEALADGSDAQMAAAQSAAAARGDSFVVRRTKTSRLTGVTHTKFDQYYGRHRVFPQTLTRHAPAAGGKGVNWLSGSYAAGLRADLADVDDDVGDADAAAKLDQLAAAAIAAIADDGKRERTVIGDKRSETIAYLAGEGSAARLAFYISFVLKIGNAVFSRPYSIVDALTGEMLRSWEGLDKQVAQVGEGPGGNTRESYVYGVDEPKFWVTQDGNTCHTVTPEVVTGDARTGFSNAYTCFYYDGDAVNGGLSPMNDGQAFGKNVLDFYMDWYGENPIGFQLIMLMHWDQNNAVWTGTQMQYGDGDGIDWYPLISLDIAAHELSHGFTEFNSNLIYSQMSGGMNEAFSDMMGVAAEFWYYGEADWMIGERIKVNGQPLRWVDDPPLDRRSIDHASQHHQHMDVHYSSGVYNKAFYLMATAFGSVRTAMDLFYCANEAYWTPDSTFDVRSLAQRVVEGCLIEEGANGVGLCALDLGICVKAVYCVFAEVGVDMGSLDAVCDTNPCVNGVCLNIEGQATCRCCDGFVGDACDVAGDACSSLVCDSPTVCSYDAMCGLVACACPAGYTGEDCDIDIDECADGLHECHFHAQCTNTIGSANCTCDDGYTGDGFNCVDINECAAGVLECAVNEQCVNTDGSAVCICKDGLTGSECDVDIDECAEGLLECAGLHAQCVNTFGSASCVCDDGYMGDGITCIRECQACNGSEGVDSCKKYGYCFAVTELLIAPGCRRYCQCLQRKTGKQAKWKCAKPKRRLATTCNTCSTDAAAAGCEAAISVDTCGMLGCVQGSRKKFCGKAGRATTCLDFDPVKLLAVKDSKLAQNVCLP